MTSERRSVAPSGEDELAIADLIEAFAARVQAGEVIDVDSFAAEHPAYAEKLRRLLPGVQVLANLEPSASDSDPDGAQTESRDGTLSGVLGDFRILRQVGKGGMGVVYEAEQISLRRRVALKVLPFAATMDARHLQRFRNEAQAAACLHHTNIVPVFSVGCERGVHFYAMQFIDGQPLSEIIRQMQQAEKKTLSAGEVTAAYQASGLAAASTVSPAAEMTPLSVEGRRSRDYYRKVAELGIQAAEALYHAHQLGIVHRDIKPGNLMLDGRGNLWAMDFGLAHMQHSEASLTLTGQAVGTPRYMSPEQASIHRVPIDHRTDVYSLGVTLYELLTLRPAFAGEDRQELLRQIAFEEPVRPRRLERAIPVELEIIVLKAMEKRPRDRYAEAQELADDLRRWLLDRPIRARRPSPVQVARKWLRRHRGTVMAATVCLMVTLTALIGIVGWVLGDRAARQHEAEDKTLESLKQAEPRLREGDPGDPLLISAAERVEAQLSGGMLGPELRQRAEQFRKDLKMLAEMEWIRLDQAEMQDNHWDYIRSYPQYVRVFCEYGIDVETLDPGEVASRVQASAIHEHLVAGLEDWAYGLRSVGKEEAAAKAERIVTIANQVDPDPWRKRLRGLLLTRNTEHLEQLARSAPVDELPVSTLSLLGRWAESPPASENAGPMIELLRRAQRRFQADFWINQSLARALYKLQPPRLEEGIGFFRAAVAARPRSAGAYLNLGLALSKSGQLDDAIATYRETIRLKRDWATAHFNLAFNLALKGVHDEAITEYRKAIRIEKDYAQAHNNLGVELANKRLLDEAILEFREAIRIHKDFAEFYRNLGRALRDRGQVKEAIAELRRAIQIKQDLVNAHYDLGFTLASQGLREEAIAEFQKVIQLQKDHAGAHYHLGVALEQKRQFEEAIMEYREVIRIKKGDAPLARRNLRRAEQLARSKKH